MCSVARDTRRQVWRVCVSSVYSVGGDQHIMDEKHRRHQQHANHILHYFHITFSTKWGRKQAGVLSSLTRPATVHIVEEGVGVMSAQHT